MQSGVIQEITRNELVLVGATSIIISDFRNQENPRKTISIRNISTNVNDVITINFGYNQAVAGAGIVLNPNEAVSDQTLNEYYQCFNGVITGICATANGKLAIFER